jgi:hypothetical protein
MQQNQAKWQIRAQKSKKSSKSTQRLKRARKAQNEHKSLKFNTPPNTLNASSPLR